MTIQESNDFLDALKNSEYILKNISSQDFSLDGIKKLYYLLGEPCKNIPIVHVVGTKGKGSTCAMLASILKSAGYNTGLYSSPHFYDRRERIRLLDNSKLSENAQNLKDLFCDEISERELCDVVSVVKPYVESLKKKEGLSLSFFEVFTIIALVYFQNKEVDVVVLEAGLGGRLDATNIVPTDVCVITPISLEHTNILGDTIFDIAREKAEIIKHKSQDVVVSSQENGVVDIVNAKCGEFFIIPEIAKSDFNGLVSSVGLKGRHQKNNAAVAIAVIEKLKTKRFIVSDKDIHDGLKNVVWPGRFEMLNVDMSVVIDCAHNEASAKVLVETFKDECTGKKAVLVLGLSDDKNKKVICDVLDDIVSRVIFTKTHHPRAVDFEDEEVKTLFPDKHTLKENNVSDAITLAIDAISDDEVVVVAGSVFLAAEARRILLL